MKQQIQEMLASHINLKEEVFDMLNELDKLSDSKMSKEDKEAFKTSKIELLKEVEMRAIFCSELKSLL